MLGRTLTGVVLRRENLRFPFPDGFATHLLGRKIESIRRRAKYLLLDLDDGRIILSHLGMSGRYTLFDAEKVKQFETSQNIDEHSRLEKRLDLMVDTIMSNSDSMMEVWLCIRILGGSESST